MVETRCIASVLPAAPHALDWRRDASRLYAARRGGGMFIFGWDHHPANSRDC
jgi:hypothetical protein